MSKYDEVLDELSDYLHGSGYASGNVADLVRHYLQEKNATIVPKNQYVRVGKVDGGMMPDSIVQTFRLDDCDKTGEIPYGTPLYVLGIRED